ncbi:MAG: ParB/RepB/Spo0J family partition protein [Syntrophomonadaceae bacterium]|nr:ParB/RepB/Spo0J family partition protein [Syntrophomonadaceae bacterium]
MSGKGSKSKGLGKGLDGLLKVDFNDPSIEIREIALKDIVRNEDQPRKVFDDESLQELADSIREFGVLQPILLRPFGKKYQLVAGERRWRASQMVELEWIPALVREVSDQEMAELSLIENLQRDDLNSVEEAVAYRRMIDEFGYSQETLADRLGKSRAYIGNTLRLLMLPEPVLEKLSTKQITAGHARTLLTLKDATDQLRTAEAIARDKITVREAELLLKKSRAPRKGRPKASPTAKQNELQAIEEKLQEFFSAKVSVIPRGNQGSIRIDYYDDDDLQRLLELLGITL